MESNNELDIYALDDINFIGTVTIENNKDSHLMETVIILDESGSMGKETLRFTNRIIPLVLSKLSYEKAQLIHLITFSHYYYKTAEQLKTFSITSRGTYMAPPLEQLRILFQKFPPNKPIRILCISDGNASDRKQTGKAALSLTEFMDQFSINSQAVRLFTSKSQPDTKALCSIMQINNTTHSKLIDISAKESDGTIARKIAALFRSDKFSRSKILLMEEKIILKFPWDAEPTSQILLFPGRNVFWLKRIPNSAIIQSSSVKIIKRKYLDLTKFQGLMDGQLIYILNHMQILKIINTVEANKIINQILKYFESTEDELAKRYCVGEKKISILLADIARDKNFVSLDAVNTAEYLRGKQRKMKYSSFLDRIIRHILKFLFNFIFVILFVALIVYKTNLC